MPFGSPLVFSLSPQESRNSSNSYVRLLLCMIVRIEGTKSVTHACSWLVVSLHAWLLCFNMQRSWLLCFNMQLVNVSLHFAGYCVPVLIVSLIIHASISKFAMQNRCNICQARSVNILIYDITLHPGDMVVIEHGVYLHQAL